MVGVVKRYICTSCGKELCVDVDAEAQDWTKADDWDLCPSCSRAWDNYKQSFLERMRKDNRADLFQRNVDNFVEKVDKLTSDYATR